MSRAVMLANAIKIDLKNEEIVFVEQAIDNIIKMANNIANINTEGVKPLFYTVDDEYLNDCEKNNNSQCDSRCDIAGNINNIFQNSKDTEGYFFTCPSIISQKK